jgi:tetratricopeptide (TPR) repeat protein
MSLDDITVVVTACARPDLLQKTLETFLQSTQFKGPIVVIEDSGIAGINDGIKSNFETIQWIESSQRQGQIKSIDTA